MFTIARIVSLACNGQAQGGVLAKRWVEEEIDHTVQHERKTNPDFGETNDRNQSVSNLRQESTRISDV